MKEFLTSTLIKIHTQLTKIYVCVNTKKYEKFHTQDYPFLFSFFHNNETTTTQHLGTHVPAVKAQSQATSRQCCGHLTCSFWKDSIRTV